MGSLLEPSGQVKPGQWELHPSSVEVEANNPYSLESAWPFPESQLSVVHHREAACPQVAAAGVLSSYCKMEAVAVTLV